MAQRLGILGGGQLGRMLALAASPLGIEVTAVDPDKDAPARVAAKLVTSGYDTEQALSALGELDVVTFEFENVPDHAAQTLASQRPVYPSPQALRISQDRLTEKDTFTQLGIKTAEYRVVESSKDVLQAFDKLGPVVLKTRRFGYDGKGQTIVSNREQAARAHAELGGAPAIAEALVPFDRELSVIICRARDGEIASYPLSQNRHEGGILRETVSPAPGLSAEVEALGLEMATRLVEHLDYVGVLALELFQVGSTLIANEFAPRVHNSGHHSIEGNVTSQFENHVRAVCGLPLGSTRPVGHSVMLNLIGGIPDRTALLRIEDCHLHDYGKMPRAGRKVGHVTVRGTTSAEARERADAVLCLISAAPWAATGWAGAPQVMVPLL